MPVRILFQDEARFRRISDKRRCWAPRIQRPEVAQQVIREFLYAVAAVDPFRGDMAALIMPWVDTEVMSLFLTYTAELFPDTFCLMFLDGAGWHTAKDLRIPSTMKLLWLPPYSPELNPAEHIWEYMRENDFGNDHFDSLDEVEARLSTSLHRLIQQPGLVKSMTSFDWIKTLSMTAN